MNPLNFTFSANRYDGVPSWAFLLIGLALVLWLWSVVVIAKEKTEDPFDRIVWLLIVLLLNFLGTLLYFFFSEKSKSSEDEKLKSEQDLKRRANEGRL